MKRFNVTINSEKTEQTNQTTVFADANEQWKYEFGDMSDPTFLDSNYGDVSLSEFFSRPIRIASYTWAPSSSCFFTLRPWQLFFENKRVLNRVINYQHLRCKLRVKIVVNGNSFYYGRALASWLPLDIRDSFSTSRIGTDNDMIQESQRPHVFLNPTESMGGELVLPFIWPSNALRVPDQEWRSMGEMNIRSFSALKHANGGTDPITINVFAWAEDVQLSIPTSNQPGALAPQAGPDEFEGAVSAPLSAVAKMSASLSDVPVIGKYAIATSQAAKAAGALANALGYSKPPNLHPNQVMDVTGDLAQVSGLDNTKKLSLDPKQSTTIDPRAMGLGPADEMSVKSISTRESYLTSISWPVTSSPEDRLWSSYVSPVLWNENVDALTGRTEIHMPACCFATLPFRSWRGTMKFRFQVVCSAYHKGRLRVSYDPSFQLSNEYNTNYNYVVDISNENDFTVDIGWGLDRVSANHDAPGSDPIPYGNIALPPPQYQANGMLTLYVVNDLTTPNSIVNNDIIINVFVSTGEDFEVYNPSYQFIDNYSYFQPIGAPPPPAAPLLSPQAGLDHPDAHETEQQDAPEQMGSVVSLGSLKTAPGTEMVYYGDPIMSFRQCLKRYNYLRSYQFANTSRAWHKWRLPNFPVYRGAAPGAIDATAAGSGYNYCKMTLMNYLTPAYVCRRGGLRYKYYYERVLTSPGRMVMIERKAFEPIGYEYTNFSSLDIAATLSARARECLFRIPNTWTGCTFQDTNNNPVVSVELPYYTNQRFSYAKYADVTIGGEQVYDNQFHAMTVQSAVVASTALVPRIDCHVAAADDFSLAMFVGAPRIFRQAVGSDPA